MIAAEKENLPARKKIASGKIKVATEFFFAPKIVKKADFFSKS